MIPSIIALLPMKENSERVPHKNIRKFGDAPLFYHILKTLNEIDEISYIVINTDSNQIKELSKDFQKVYIHDRPKNICGGHVPMNIIINHDIKLLNSKYFLQTHATNPLITSTSIRKAIKFYFDNINTYDSLFSVTKIQQRLYDKNFIPVNHNPDKLINTQELDPIYIENSCFYIFSRDSFLNNNYNRIGKRPYPFVIPQIESFDIDTEDDFKIAEFIYLSKHQII